MRKAVAALALIVGIGIATAGVVAADHAHASASRRATLATFAGTWYGHTRTLKISRTGTAKEVVYDGCCIDAIEFTFKLSRPVGTTLHADAHVVLTEITHLTKSEFTTSPPPHVGQVGIVRLSNGILSEPFMRTVFCGPAAKIGACGA